MKLETKHLLMSCNAYECICRHECLDFIIYQMIINNFLWLMHMKGIHVPCHIPLDNWMKVVDHLLNILSHLHDIIDILENHWS